MTLQNPEQLLPKGFDYIDKVLSDAKAMALYDHLVSHLNWQQPEILVFGKYHRIPRLQCFIAEPDVHYGYSNSQLVKEPWPDALLAMRNRLQRVYGQAFNALLVNWYRDGEDSMGWHSDDEKELGLEPVIVSISLGATRKFTIRHKQTARIHSLLLRSGSCLVMHSHSQSAYQHALPKQKKVTSGRINLTFRTVGQ